MNKCREFKTGDVIVCVNVEGGKSLTEGKEYVVTSMCGEYVRSDDDTGGKDAGYGAWRFDLATDERQALSDAIALVQKYKARVSATDVYCGAAELYTLVQGKELVLDVIFPPTPTAQELEVARIETEMRALADSLAKLKA